MYVVWGCTCKGAVKVGADLLLNWDHHNRLSMAVTLCMPFTPVMPDYLHPLISYPANLTCKTMCMSGEINSTSIKDRDLC